MKIDLMLIVYKHILFLDRTKIRISDLLLNALFLFFIRTFTDIINNIENISQKISVILTNL